MIDEHTIKAVARAGFDVYMREPKDTWLIFTDGTRIGYLQNDGPFRGISLSTVHIPNTTTGTGFKLDDGLSVADLTPSKLGEALAHAPHWASGHDRVSVHKWKNFESYKASSRFNGEYKLVAPADAAVAQADQ